MSQNSSEPFVFRVTTTADAGAIAGLINACSMEQGRKPQATPQSIRANMEMPGLNLETDTVLAVDQGGGTVGYALVQDNPPNTSFFTLAEVHPERRGQGIDTALCHWIEDRARQAIPGRPAGARVTLLQKWSSQDKPAQDLLLGQGYQVVRHNFRMVIDMQDPPPQPERPAGLVIRPFVREEEGRVLVQVLCEAFRDNWGYVKRPFELEYQRWMHLLDSDDESETAPHWLVAVDGQEIAGFALSRLRLSQDPEGSWIYVVGVRPSWRRRGIALALLQHSFWVLYQQGKRRVSLEVDAQNLTGATRLYEKAGMRVESRYEFLEKELRPGRG